MNRSKNTASVSDTLGLLATTSSPKFPRILLAEDNDINRALATDILEFLGFTVHAVTDGKQALHAALQHSFDLILMDCQMPLLNGYEATRQIRTGESESGQAKTPIVAISGHAVAEDREKCLAAGMNDYLQKPFTVAELQEKTSRWIPYQRA
jgi:CheY-like chemotaxis protein